MQRRLPMPRRRSPARPAAAPTPIRTRADFSTIAAAPVNSSAPASPCSGGGGSSSTFASASVRLQIQPVIAIALGQPTLDFGGLVAGATAPPVSENVTVTSNDTAGYTLTAHRSAFSPRDLPLGLSATAPSGGSLGAGISPTVLAALPIAPAADLTIGSTSAAAPAAGDSLGDEDRLHRPAAERAGRAVHRDRHVHGDPALTVRILLLVLLALATVAPASAGAPRRSGLVVWPARATLVAGSTTTLHVANHTRTSVAVAVRTMGLALDLRGAPRLVRSSAGTALVSVRSGAGRHPAGAVGSIGVRVLSASRARRQATGRRSSCCRRAAPAAPASACRYASACRSKCGCPGWFGAVSSSVRSTSAGGGSSWACETAAMSPSGSAAARSSSRSGAGRGGSRRCSRGRATSSLTHAGSSSTALPTATPREGACDRPRGRSRRLEGGRFSVAL